MATMSTSSQEASPSAFGGHGPLLVGVSWALAIITTILLALRSYTRVHLVENGAGHAALLWAWAAWVSRTHTLDCEPSNLH